MDTSKLQINLNYVIWFGVFNLLVGISLKVARAGEGMGLGGYLIGTGIWMIVLTYFLKRHYVKQPKLQRRLDYAVWFWVFDILVGISLKVGRVGDEFFGIIGIGGEYWIEGGIIMIVFAYFLKWRYAKQKP